ncbi:NAD(P)/FAD-dependent oxidoreductase [Cryobacterium sp. TMT1-21]|uniref:NAD(P)/FAD-dependent oxidoreductase n=1 Tax=Cryobacterium shii TaxID=1259235 RepID=A0AAQ2HEZ6_9MICO|nr:MULTISPECIES: FAD-dependent oxidoreductase [Cryobacterium]TFC42823.1 NAD(P)/FAD-dependent oxidoreductase [Cryobacterium shii]TFC86696.1 NAD(P)/FAD-dependent oxidoreductase [Cryobacterium sp. TmT2-59]TFD14758.1 NAD(P)/FAD-dependent oxidoreductase [Cryobacterium sp. TMT1-21]TFD23260.1 NAD(P)/FAD-dependent oxidoreductase [Cryobacterium sp. TMT2-23]TFD42380.1 NAD(P)/FAD-dependent oxidoreductase [Cryobacterium sp. TMT2-10]
MRTPTFVVVGAGLAGARAAETFRSEGFTGRIVLVAGENEYPYIRPPLSKGFLTGAEERHAIYVHPAEWYNEREIEVKRGCQARAIALDTHELALPDRESLRYDKLLLATGASARPFPGAGADLAGVFRLRTARDSETLRTELARGDRHVVIVGAGWIGLEVASAARGYGNAVTVLGRETVPLNTAIGDQAGAVFAQLHRENGVELRMETLVARLTGENGVVTGVALAGGEVVPADVVVVGIGAVPNTELAVSAGLAVDNGIVVDAAFRSIDPDVYAVGDVASVFHPVLRQHLRVEHWDNAERAGAAAGRSMLDQAVSYDQIPYFYTDQFDLGMEYSGYGPLARDAVVVFRGDRAARKFIAFWVAEGLVVAGMNVNVWDVNETVQRFISLRVRVDPARLADERVALDDLLVGASEWRT